MLSYFCCSVHALFVLFFYVILDSKRSNNTSPEDGKELEPLNPTSPKGREERNPDDKEGLKRSVNESLFYSVTAVHTHTNIPSGFLIFSSLYFCLKESHMGLAIFLGAFCGSMNKIPLR